MSLSGLREIADKSRQLYTEITAEEIEGPNEPSLDTPKDNYEETIRMLENFITYCKSECTLQLDS